MRAVLFDLDGTLVDSGADIALHLGHVAAAFGQPPFALADVCAWVGGGGRALVRRAWPELAAAEHEARYHQLIASYITAPVVHTTLYGGIADVLTELADANVPMAILSNKPHALVEAIAAELLSPWPFVAIVGGRDTAPKKPDPAMAAPIFDALGVPPTQCVLVGDSEADVGCAHAAGMTSIAVTWGFRSPASLRALAPHHLVDNVGELGTTLRVLRSRP